MMKNNKKKGFTIVELVIVIAVIAILAAVLIPTFSNVVEKAKKSNVLQGAKNTYTQVLAEDMADGLQDGKVNGTDVITDATKPESPAANTYYFPLEGEYVYTVSDTTVTFTYTANGYKATLNADGSWKIDPAA